MDWLHICILALIQGITEFLPISSSAHLILPTHLLGWQDQGLAFDVGVHVGTLAAVVWYFRHDLHQLLKAFSAQLAGQPSGEGRLAWWVILGTLPALVAGFLLNDLISHYGRSLLVIGSTTVLFGALLGWADYHRTEVKPLARIGWRDALWIGLAQALALIPGTSRSGITISVGLLLGLTRQAAARFSFLLSVPIILAAGSYKTLELLTTPAVVNWPMIVGGMLLAAASALACIHLFLTWLDRIGMWPFVIYRLLLGGLLLVLWLQGGGYV